MKYNLNFDTSDLTFLTACDKKYLNFIEPYVYFADLSNPGCHFEIFVPDKSEVKTNNPNVTFNNLPNGHSDVLRYIVEPTKPTRYTYITDIDILHTELVQPFHINFIEKTGNTFSNVKRTNKNERMSGLHFVETDKWYKDTEKARGDASKTGQDEHTLYKIIKQAYPNAILSESLMNRPVHGIHCSVGRTIYDIPGWEVTSQRLAFFNEALKNSPEFNNWFTINVTNKLLPPKKRKKYNVKKI